MIRLLGKIIEELFLFLVYQPLILILFLFEGRRLRAEDQSSATLKRYKKDCLMLCMLIAVITLDP